MAETFHFELVSPESLLLSADVEQVVVPGSEGQFTVLPRHAPFMSTLKPGAVEITSGGQTQSFFVAEVFTGSPGKLVALEDTIKGFKGLVEGEYDHLPESAFYMVGTIEEAVEKAQRLAEAA